MPDDDECSCGVCVQCGKCLFQIAWHCTQFWTTISIASIVVWIIYRPYRFHPRVDSAVLYALNTVTGPPANATEDQPQTSLRYDLAVDMSFHNPHHHLKIRYLDIGATAFYGDTRLGAANDALPAPFRQGPKNTTVLHPAFQGTVAVDSGIAAGLERELAAGTVHIRVSVSLTLKYKLCLTKEISFYKYDCWLWFPPPHSAAPAVFDFGTMCRLAK